MVRVGFVVEQALGHVAYGLGLRKALARRGDLECVWLDIPYAMEGFGRIPMAGPNWTLRGSARAWRSVRDAHASAKLDALFLHTQTVSLFAGGHMRRIPTLLSLDATPRNLDEIGGSYAHKVGSASIENLKLAAHRHVMRRASRFTTWSKWTKDSLVREYGARPEDVTVIHPGTVLGNYPDPSERQRPSDGPLRILFVGADFIRKGGDLLLDIFRKHLRGRAELHLITAAEVPAGDGVFVYRGLKPHSPELLACYRQADVFALPTRGDCLAVVLGEAMAACLPIITTRVGAHAEAVDDGQSGFVLGVDDAEGLRDRLERLAGDRDLAFRMGQASRRIGEERFDMHKNANRIADILVELGTRRTS
ncbi:MAG TPA: glycosyltransferase family 4 protein [Polyangiaceae bacterium]|nr:glycosyltransferase family 4 protein [Polyangiaceae bacterium]